MRQLLATSLVFFGCVGLAQSFGTLSCGEDNQGLRVGDSANICIGVNGQKKMVFSPEVDTFSVMHLSGSASAIPANAGFILEGGNTSETVSTLEAGNTYFVTIEVAIGSQTSHQRLLHRIEIPPLSGGAESGYENFTIPLYTAVISLQDGNVDFVAMDEGCLFCEGGTSACQQDFVLDAGTVSADTDFQNCATPRSECSGDSCDLRLYVVWQGTDADSIALQSANKRFSQFRRYGATSLVRSAIKIGGNTATTVADEANEKKFW